MTLEEAKQLKSGDIILSNDRQREYVLAEFELIERYLKWNITKKHCRDWVYGQFIDKLHVKKIHTPQLFQIY